MLNLLSAELDHAGLVAIFRKHPPASPLPVLGDARWTRAFSCPASAAARDALLTAAGAERDQPLPELTDALYADYAATGVRLNFENPYFERRSRLARAALALLARGEAGESPESRSFLAKLEAILDECSWALTAHVKNDTGRDARTVDLFASRTANALAEYLRIFAAVVPDGMRSRIRGRLRDTVFLPYLETDFFWLENTNNWNAVCHQGILGAAFTVENDADLLARLCLRARAALPVFLRGFGPDGACSEGPAYWDFGFGWFAYLNLQMETRTGGELSLFADASLAPLMAGYAPAMSLEGGAVVNFADCAPGAPLRPHILHYLGERLALPACRREAHAQLRAHLADGADFLAAKRTDFFYWGRLLLDARDILDAERAETSVVSSDAFYPSYGLWVVRGRDRAGRLWELAAKGGHNDEHHNHNDVGSWLLHIDGVPLVTELGRPAYTRDFFTPSLRYTFLAARTLGHSLPVINGCEQSPGEAFAGRVLRAETDADTVVFELDATAAYPAEAGCERFVRRLVFEKSAGRVTWTDRIRLGAPGEVESAVITRAGHVELESPEVAVIREAGRVLELRIARAESGACAIAWTRVESHAYTAHDGRAASCRRLVLSRPAGPDARAGDEFVCEIVLTLRDAG